MHGNITPEPKPEKPAAPAEVKYRTITLTNRAPIKIAEEGWPVIAQGTCGGGGGECSWQWSIEVRVRQDITFKRMIVHAKYEFYDESTEVGQTVRVGRVLTERQASVELSKHILEVGEEMRSRIQTEFHQKHVVYALDACFAKLPALNY